MIKLSVILLILVHSSWSHESEGRIIERLNRWRSNLAMFQNVTNMHEIVYDRNLEVDAKSYSSKIHATSGTMRDRGMTHHLTKTQRELGEAGFIDQVFNSKITYQSKHGISPHGVADSKNFKAKAFDVTQMIWAQASRVGCYINSWVKGGEYYKTLTCKFNVEARIGRYIGIKGPFCTECAPDQCNQSTGLCGTPGNPPNWVPSG